MTSRPGARPAPPGGHPDRAMPELPDIATCIAAVEAHSAGRARGGDQATRPGHEKLPLGVDPPAAPGMQWLPNRGRGGAPRGGRARPVREAVPALPSAVPAHRLRRSGDEPPSALPEQGDAPSGPDARESPARELVQQSQRVRGGDGNADGSVTRDTREEPGSGVWQQMEMLQDGRAGASFLPPTAASIRSLPVGASGQFRFPPADHATRPPG